MKTMLLVSFCLVILATPLAAAEFDVRNDAEFKKLLPEGAKVEKLASGLKFTEGPNWLKWEGGFLVFSDIPANELKKWTAKDGVVTWRNPSQNTNGNATDLEGNLICAQHGAHAILRVTKDGKATVLIDQYEGKPLNSPNDVVVKSDGTIWFTDPDYGLMGRKKEQEKNRVYRFNPADKSLKPLVDDFNKPNGLAFSPDEKKLYIADSGTPRHIRVFDVLEDGTISGGAVFCKIDKGGPDGIRVDSDGRVWSSAGDGVHVFGTDGALIGKILVPESPANLCFGDADGKTLFITARTGLYMIKTNVTQAGPKK
jgi:gluconolactonase